MFETQQLDASQFIRSKGAYIWELNSVIDLLIDCYGQITINENFELCDIKEEYLRNILVGYLRRNKAKYHIEYLAFEIESGEINSNQETIGYMDIKVINMGLTESLKCDENAYFCMECKRLDGNLTKTLAYINEGIFRFIVGKYSKTMPMALMIGFVENGEIIEIVDDINRVLQSHKQINTYQLLKQIKSHKGFNGMYTSHHERSKNIGNITLYHLMFDYSVIIVNNT